MFEDVLQHGANRKLFWRRARVLMWVVIVMIVGGCVVYIGRHVWWHHRIAQVTPGMTPAEVVRILGPLPPKNTSWLPSSEVTYCVNYFFFNGGPGADVCFDATDRVVVTRIVDFVGVVSMVESGGL